jgi:SAM-dependent methyltransferase
MHDDARLLAYYEGRAAHYDRIYAAVPPAWVVAMVADMRRALRDRSVLEIACGTGHWTQDVAAVARRVLAVDASPAMRAIAAAKLADLPHVTVVDGDAYDLGPTVVSMNDPFTGGLAMQWLSHVPAARREAFLTGWHAHLAPGAVVFLGDNQLTAEWRSRLHSDGADTFEARELPDGSAHLVLKNYFDEADLRGMVEPYADVLDLTMGERWWWLAYRLR